MLLLTTVSRCMDIVHFTVDNFDTSFRNDVNQLVDASGVSRDWARREDNGIAGLELHLTVGSVSDTREGRHRLPLTTCTEDQNLACRVVFDFIWLDKGSLRSFDVAKLDTVDNGLFHRTSKDRNLASSLNSGIRCLLETEDI